ncbi:helix-turn-helix domain-containing protein [Paenibacillus sp. LMG 31456]|uniref:Helix-turn-helix domain-containing protein n=1 Tax=Paenibacillus foliorum TaxID=2654974 RepID=A0A972K2Z8_9BACL|nr:helix-turn-helix domain-containing protein [Paenibacillus foliorum]NOU97281.1 helix-turn-helix domain-containing protein [Paenibacillus foliorum]
MSSAPGLESGLRILEILRELEEASFLQLKQQLDLSPASLSRYLKTLSNNECVEKNERQHYVLGRTWRRLQSSLTETHFEPIIATALEDVSSTLGITSLWIRIINGNMICQHKRTVPEGLAMQDVGSERTDYMIHPWGFLFLASQKEDYRRFLIENASVSPLFHDYRPPSEVLLHYISEAENEGISDDLGTIFPHVRRIAVPILREGKMVAAIAVGMIGTTFPEDRIQNIKSCLQNKSHQIMKLGV